MPIFGKKIIFSDEAHFDLGRDLGHRKPARIHKKADAPKTRHCLVRILTKGIIGTFLFESEQGETITVKGDR